LLPKTIPKKDAAIAGRRSFNLTDCVILVKFQQRYER
jgi:hypothetical protein